MGSLAIVPRREKRRSKYPYKRGNLKKEISVWRGSGEPLYIWDSFWIKGEYWALPCFIEITLILLRGVINNGIPVNNWELIYETVN